MQEVSSLPDWIHSAAPKVRHFARHLQALGQSIRASGCGEQQQQSAGRLAAALQQALHHSEAVLKAELKTEFEEWATASMEQGVAAAHAHIQPAEAIAPPAAK